MEEKWWLLLETHFETLSHDLQRHLYESFYRFAYKETIFLLRDHALVEDIIQEAFLKVTAKRHQLNKATAVKEWMKRIIRNQMLDTIRKKNRHELSLGNVYKENSTPTAIREIAASVEDTVEEAWRNQILHETILELKEEYRSLLLKYYMEEKSYREIASEFGISEQVIAQRLARARKKLLGQFSRKWVDEDEQ